MLILTRRVNQKIIIGKDIEVTLLNIFHPPGMRPYVRIGIDCPKHISIVRDELIKEGTDE